MVSRGKKFPLCGTVCEIPCFSAWLALCVLTERPDRSEQKKGAAMSRCLAFLPSSCAYLFVAVLERPADEAIFFASSRVRQWS